MHPLVGDASFRRYYRLQCSQQTYIGVNAPPSSENNAGFVQVSDAFAKLHLNVPQVLATDFEKGFLLITDLGNDVFAQKLHKNNADQLYRLALDKLAIIQTCPTTLPPFDAAFIQGELTNFRHWLLEKHWELTPSPTEEKLLEKTFHQLITSATEQPQCCVHRDYHSRNLMLLPNDQLGILDFQDAVIGPVTYDAVSLLRDCYIDWPKEKVREWALYFYELIRARHPNMSAEQYLRWFDWMGIQRHLKAAFIFARKYHRDHNDGYLKELPRTLGYVLAVGKQYPELDQFTRWLSEKMQ